VSLLLEAKRVIINKYATLRSLKHGSEEEIERERRMIPESVKREKGDYSED
jgi:hypothetical protein